MIRNRAECQPTMNNWHSMMNCLPRNKMRQPWSAPELINSTESYSKKHSSKAQLMLLFTDIAGDSSTVFLIKADDVPAGITEGADAGGRLSTHAPLTSPTPSSKAVAPSPRFLIFQPNTRS